MNLISAADFEQQIYDIATNGKPLDERRKQAQELMCKTLDSLGYHAGVKVCGCLQWYIGKDEIKDDKEAD